MPSGAASSAPDRRALFGLSGDTSAGNEWQGSNYTASTGTFKKWWPAVYSGDWKLPNGMRYPFIWKLETIRIEGSQAVETWTWEWVETPHMPSIAQVEQLLTNHARDEAARRSQASASTPAAGEEQGSLPS